MLLEMLAEFKKGYERPSDARVNGDEKLIRHAERNFYACAEAMARQLNKRPGG